MFNEQNNTHTLNQPTFGSDFEYLLSRVSTRSGNTRISESKLESQGKVICNKIYVKVRKKRFFQMTVMLIRQSENDRTQFRVRLNMFDIASSISGQDFFDDSTSIWT